MEKIKIDLLHADTETIISIGQKIVQRHMSLGASSPISTIVVADLNSRISSAREKHEEGAKYKKLMEDAWRDRDHYLGKHDKGVQYTLNAIGNILKEENVNLQDWGF